MPPWLFGLIFYFPRTFDVLSFCSIVWFFKNFECIKCVLGGLALPFSCPDGTGGAVCVWGRGMTVCLRNLAAKEWAHASTYTQGTGGRESRFEFKRLEVGFYCTWRRPNASNGWPCGVRCVSRLAPSHLFAGFSPKLGPNVCGSCTLFAAVSLVCAHSSLTKTWRASRSQGSVFCGRRASMRNMPGL